MQLRIVHTTRFHYKGGASASFNQARMTPATGPEQIVIHERLDVSPPPWTYAYGDYFGTPVVAFEIADPHDSMTVTSTSTVQVNRAQASAPRTPWEAYVEREVADRWTEFLMLPAVVAPPEELALAAREAADRSALPGEAALAVCRLVDQHVAGVAGAGEPPSPAVETWHRRSGTVPEKVHLVIGALRSLGIPARYVSGYVHPVAEPVVGETVAGDSRAWVEWWDDGWHAFDPCFDTVPDDRYVIVGHGREYDDVAPLRGIYSGAIASEMEVAVEVTRLA